MCAGESQVDAHALLLTCCVAIYMSFPFGMSTAATIRVGNLVGGNRPAEARLSGDAGTYCTVMVSYRWYRIVHEGLNEKHRQSSCIRYLVSIC